jgi:CelD/BcsL family acetyltransferase involved in cellulose biosynthesis
LPVKCEYHNNFAVAQAAAAGALDREAQACLFDRLDWLESLHRIALRSHAPALLKAALGKAQAWLPLIERRSGHLAALANWYNFTWAPIFTSADDEVARMVLLRALAQFARQHARRLALAPMPDEDGSASQLQAAFEAEGWTVFRTACDVNHILKVNGRSFDAYWDGRPSRLKNTVKRKGKAGVVTVRIETEYAPESWHDYERVYAKSWKPSEGSPDFLRQLAERESVAGALRLGLAYIDGTPVAAQFWTVENGTALIHKLAHDAAHIQASPGTLLSAALFQHVIDIDRVETIDFGTGGDAYKAEWMDEVRDRFALEIFWPNHPANWPHIAIRKLRAYRASYLP